MSFAERGIFLEMLIEQWMRGDLPDNPQSVADAIASSDAQVREIEAAWPAVRRQYLEVARKPGRIVNSALERVRHERQKYLRGLSERGQRAAEARWKPHETEPLNRMRVHSARMPEDANTTGSGSTGNGSTGARSRAREADLDLERAARLRQELYPQWFHTHRGGHIPLIESRNEIAAAAELCKLWTDERLEQIAAVVLTTDDPWISRTDRGFWVFVKKASWADERLRQAAAL